DVTYHGPGQLVGYPILHLGARKLPVGTYLRELEGMLIAACARLGLAAERVPGFTGVWARGKKLASIGVAVTGWISYHGFALNVDMDLAPFRDIHPCRLEPEQMASLASLLGRPVPMDEAKAAVRAAFTERFA
ncbi:MAG TPA: lipoyl(octanoyl) transferase LipB, partial [Elusimicrobiota bacterium]|nr:lipoyl(octanoyl) transferase LipB [Elusimicrobiota bacterium]